MDKGFFALHLDVGRQILPYLKNYPYKKIEQLILSLDTFKQIRDHYLSRTWYRRRSSLYQGKSCVMRSWQVMAGWSSLGMRLLTFSLVKPNFSLSSGKSTLCLLDGSCATSGEQGSSHSTGPRPGKGRGGQALHEESRQDFDPLCSKTPIQSAPVALSAGRGLGHDPSNSIT